MSLFVSPVTRATDANDNPLSGAKWYFYATGTLTPVTTYTTAGLLTPHANPVVADSSGLFPPIFLDDATVTRGILRTAAGVLIQDIDPINADASSAAVLDARWFGLSTAGTGAENKAAMDAAIAHHLSTGIPLVSPAGTFNHTGALVVEGNYYNIEGSNWGKTVFKPTSATESVILKGRYGRFANIGVDGSVAGTYGIVLRGCAETAIEYCDARNFDNDGLLIDPDYGGGAAGNNNNLRIVGGSYNLNGGCGVKITHASDNNDIGFHGVNASSNGSHGFLLRGHGGYVDPICIAEGNGGYGFQIGEDADPVDYTGWLLDHPYTESNTAGGIRGSSKSENNIIRLKNASGTQSYTGHASSGNVAESVTSGLYRFGSGDGVTFMQASAGGSEAFLLAAHVSGGNVNLNLGPAGTGTVLISGTTRITGEVRVNGGTGTARYYKFYTDGADSGAYIALGGSNIDLFYNVPAGGGHSLQVNGGTVVSVSGTAVAVTGNFAATGRVVSSGATSGIGYATGAGGAVTQASSRTTGVTLNKASGAITLVSAAGSASWQTFTVTNSAVAATDTIDVVQKSGADLYMIAVTAVAAGSFNISFATTGGTTTEQPVFNFNVIKGVAA